MKKILEFGEHGFYLVSLGNNNVGYLIITDGPDIILDHTVCCWHNPPIFAIMEAVQTNKKSLQEVIMCSREGKGCAVLHFGLFASFSDLPAEEIDRIHHLIHDLGIPQRILEDMQAQKLKEVAALKQEQRIHHVLDLLEARRYADAKMYCEIHSLEWEAFCRNLREA